MSLAETRVLLSIKPLASCRPACGWPPPPLISRADNTCPIVQCSLLSRDDAEAGTPGLAAGWTKVPIVPVIALHQKLLAWKWLAFLLGPCRLKAVQLFPGPCVFQTGCCPFVWLSVSSQMQQFLPLPQPGSVCAGCTETRHVAFVPQEGCWGSAGLLFPGPGESSLTRCSGSLVAWRPDGNK